MTDDLNPNEPVHWFGDSHIVGDLPDPLFEGYRE